MKTPEIHPIVEIHTDPQSGADPQSVDLLPAVAKPEFKGQPAQSPDLGVPPLPAGDACEWTYKKIENREYRKDRSANWGIISIAMEPGDAQIGDVYFAVQFEGPYFEDDPSDPEKKRSKESRKHCVSGMNTTLREFQDLLDDLLKEMSAAGAQYELKFAMRPCPHDANGINLDNALAQTLGQQVTQDVGQQREVKNEQINTLET